MMSKRVLGAGIAVAMTFGLADAQAQWFVTPSGPGVLYFGVEGGWTHLDSPTDRVGGFNFKEHFDDGFNVGARAGYEWGPLRFEEEFNFGQNDLNRLSGSGFSLAAHGQRNRYAIMTNAIYDFPLGWIVTPHLGVGIGAVNLHNSIGLRPIGGFGPCSAGCALASSSEWEFGYQAIAGIRYKFTPSLAFDLDYRYLATTDPTLVVRAPSSAATAATGLLSAAATAAACGSACPRLNRRGKVKDSILDHRSGARPARIVARGREDNRRVPDLRSKTSVGPSDRDQHFWACVSQHLRQPRSP